jgi:hypothetical protein
MNRDDFIDVYMRMSTAQREQLDELIEEKIEKEQQLDDLQAKLDQLTPEQLADAEDSQDEFIKNMAEEEQEITGAEYSVDDPEEAEQLRQVDWANLRDERYARLVEDFPAGILIIEDELEKIEDDMRSLVPIKK